MHSFNCPSCNAHNASNARFCASCGSSLLKPQAQTTPYQTPGSNPEAALVSAFAFAGFWKRFIAYILDAIIYTFVFAMILMVLGGSILSISPSNPEKALAAAGIYLFYYPGWWLYFALLESSSLQGTIGKKILGIKVTDLQGQPIGFGQATARHFSAFVTQLTFTIGYLMAGFSARKQALHDMIANTLVVNKRYGPAQIKVASENPGSGMSVAAIVGIVFLVLLIPIGGIIAAIAIPAYQDYTLRAKVSEAIVETQYIQPKITVHAAQSGYWPNTLEQAGVDTEQLRNGNYEILLAGEGAYQIVFKKPLAIADSRVNFIPKINKSGSYDWECRGVGIENKFLPKKCRD